MESETCVQSQDNVVCVSLCANALGKGMTLSHLPLTM